MLMSFLSLGSLQAKYVEMFGEEIRAEQLEAVVFNDINETLNLFNQIIPSIIRGSYTFIAQCTQLWAIRDSIDILAIVRPTLLGLIGESINLSRERLILDQQSLELQRNQSAMSRVVSNIVDGLAEIQCYNSQSYQLQRLDSISQDEINSKQGLLTAVNSIYRTISNRSVFDFASEVYIIKRVMERRHIDHETYRKIQNDIDYNTRLFARIYSLGKEAYRIFDTQQRVIQLLNLPSFINEIHQAPPQFMQGFQLKSMKIQRVRFRYKESLPLALDIQPIATQPLIRTANTNAQTRAAERKQRKTPKRNKNYHKVKQNGQGEDDNDRKGIQIGAASAEGQFEGTLEFERGKTYAIIGTNRSGKSTLVQLLCKIYNCAPEDCDIILNDSLDFNSIPRTSLREIISYVPQRPFIFPGTIEENIRIGNTTASIEQVEAAAEAAGLFIFDKPKPISSSSSNNQSLVNRADQKIQLKPWEENRLKTLFTHTARAVSSFWKTIHSNPAIQPASITIFNTDNANAAPLSSAIAESSNLNPAVGSLLSNSLTALAATEGLGTSSGSGGHPILQLETAERGTNLSGGFAQSVALARVFLRNSSQIIILDESLSQMDTIKKREFIFPRLFDFVKKNNQLLILISHDLPLACELVDCVYVMQGGKCVQKGSHQQLLASKAPPYCRLVGQY
jgi:ABC-type multidrug transport system fused ATPase/permease subunit